MITPLTEPGDVIHLLAAALTQGRNLADDALTAVAGWCVRPVSELRAKLAAHTAADLDVFLDMLPVDRRRDLVAVALLLLRWQHQGNLPTPEQFLDRLEEALHWPKSATLRLLAAIAGLAPATEWPALLLAADGADTLLVWLVKASRTAAALVTCLPGLTIGLAVPRDVLDEYLSTAVQSQAVALLREGRILLPSGNRQELSRRVEEAGGDAAAAAPAIEAVLERGGDAGLAARLVEVTHAVARLDEANEESEEQARGRRRQVPRGRQRLGT